MAIGGTTPDDGEEPGETPRGLRIAARLRNSSSTTISLSGWILQDRAGNVFPLSGSVAAGAILNVRMTDFSMPLNNSGDDVSLIDPAGVIQHHITYRADQVATGQLIEFPDLPL